MKWAVGADDEKDLVGLGQELVLKKRIGLARLDLDDEGA